MSAARARARAQTGPTPQQDATQRDSSGGADSNAARQALLQEAGPVPHRAELEQRFGQDLAWVKAVTGMGESVRDAGADAFSLDDGLLLFAEANPTVEQTGHEVAHALQDGGQGTSQPGGSAEQEASEAGEKAAAGEDVDVTGAAGGEVQGDWLTGAIIGGLVGGLPGAIVGGLVGDALDEDTPEEQIEAFKAQSFAPLLNHEPSSGGMFDVAFDAASLRLTITLKVGFDFVAGDKSEAVAGFRDEEFEWTPEEEAEWRTHYMADVVSTWSEQHTFRSTQEGWDAVQVACVVSVVQDDANPHYILHVAKYPDDAGMVGSSACAPGTNHDPTPGSNACLPNAPDAAGDTPIHGNAEMDSNDMRPEAKLDWGAAEIEVHFDKGSTALSAAGRAELDPAKTQLTADATKNATLTGHASSDHPPGMTAAEGAIHNMDLARARTSAVQGEFTGAGVAGDKLQIRNEGEDSATDDESWCRVDVRVGTNETQNAAVHETGHMFGLGDEYGTAGTDVRATYKTLLADQAGVEILRGETDSVMSNGSTVESWHYSSFLEAFKAITAMDTWSL